VLTFGGDSPMNGSTSARANDGAAGGAPVADGGYDAWHEAAASLPGPGGNKMPILSSHHGHDLEHWPLHHTLVLGALDSAVPSARAHLRQLMREWGHAELEEDASVVISELVTNAVVASAKLGPAVAPVLVWLGSNRNHVLLAVADASLRPPMRLPLAPYAYGGRGLALVEALSSRWGWCPVSIAGLVKAVWAEWRLPSEVGHQPTIGQPNRCYAV
jgi:anti-sigma regulatory factor (Ser/Thr protein kinase)